MGTLGWTRGVTVLIGSVFTLAPCAALAETIYGGIAWTTSREFGGFSEQPEGSVVTVDPSGLGPADDAAGFSMTPGGTTLLADVFDPPPPNDVGHLQGIAYTGGSLYAASVECDGCFSFSGPSRLIEVDAGTGAANEIGLIIDGGSGDGVNVYDLATNPTTGMLYGISTVLDENDFGAGCFGCLYTIDTLTAAATLLGVVDFGFGGPGGLAFQPDGTLRVTTVFPTGESGSRQELLTLDSTDGSILAREDILLEQQFMQSSTLIETAPFQGLASDASGRLVATGDNGITILYERVMGVVLDPSGSPVSGATEWVWRRLGDSGENLGDLVFVPEPSTALLLGLGLADLARRRRR